LNCRNDFISATNLYDNCSEEQEVLGYTIKLISIEPYPERREIVSDSNYSVKMVVNR